MSDTNDLKVQIEYLQRIIQTQEITNKLLQTSLSEPSLNKLLELSIEHIVSAPLLPFKSKGAIFLIEDEPDVLILKAQRGLSDYLLKTCAKVPFGKCLCGKAAKNKEIVFASCLDEDHDITYDGIPAHGHYCVPIMFNSKLLGVINLYVDHGHKFQTKEYEFIQAIGNIIAGMISRRQSEIELKQTQLNLLQTGKLAAIGQLAAGIAHEINNPMGFIGSNLSTFEEYTNNFLKIISMSEILIESIEKDEKDKVKDTIKLIKDFEQKNDFGYLTKDVNELINQSKDGVERIRKIVIDLKQFSHEKSNVIEIINIKETMESVIRIAMNEIKYKAKLKTEYGQISDIEGDSQKLGQVFINLIINAAQAINHNGIISIKTYEKDDAVFISISDTGCGIPDSILTEIFNPFFTTKPVGQGTGLGLSISYEIITEMCGEILVESIVDKGSTFTVKLPIKRK